MRQREGGISANHEKPPLTHWLGESSDLLNNIGIASALHFIQEFEGPSLWLKTTHILDMEPGGLKLRLTCSLLLPED